MERSPSKQTEKVETRGGGGYTEFKSKEYISSSSEGSAEPPKKIAKMSRNEESPVTSETGSVKGSGDKMGSADSYSNSLRNCDSCEEQRCPGETGTASAVTLGTEITTVANFVDKSEETFILTVRGKEKYTTLLKIRDILENNAHMESQIRARFCSV